MYTYEKKCSSDTSFLFCHSNHNDSCVWGRGRMVGCCNVLFYIVLSHKTHFSQFITMKFPEKKATVTKLASQVNPHSSQYSACIIVFVCVFVMLVDYHQLIDRYRIKSNNMICEKRNMRVFVRILHSTILYIIAALSPKKFFKERYFFKKNFAKHNETAFSVEWEIKCLTYYSGVCVYIDGHAQKGIIITFN